MACELGELAVSEAVALESAQQRRRQCDRLAHLFLEHDQVAELAQEELRDVRETVYLVELDTSPQGMQDELVALATGNGQRLEDLLLGRRQLRCGVQLARTQRLLEGLLERASDGHGLADALHVRGQLAVGERELLESPARHLDHHVVQRRLKAGGRLARDVVADLVERVAHS